MAEELNSLIDLLRNGEIVECPKCNKGKLIPYNTTYDKANSFNCEKECGFFINYDPIINVE